MEFNIDFSLIDRLALREMNISMDEAQSVFSNQNSFHKEYENFIFLLGFSNKRKFIKIAYQIAKNVNFEVEVLEIDLPYEEDIAKFWCNQ
jgi:hypothetical protein